MNDGEFLAKGPVARLMRSPLDVNGALRLLTRITPAVAVGKLNVRSWRNRAVPETKSLTRRRRTSAGRQRRLCGGLALRRNPFRQQGTSPGSQTTTAEESALIRRCVQDRMTQRVDSRTLVPGSGSPDLAREQAFRTFGISPVRGIVHADARGALEGLALTFRATEPQLHFRLQNCWPTPSSDSAQNERRQGEDDLRRSGAADL